MIKREEVQKLGELSLLAVSDEELEKVRGEIDSILEYVSELTSLSTEEVSPSEGEVFNVFREDTLPHETGTYTEALLQEAPRREGNYIKVKKIL